MDPKMEKLVVLDLRATAINMFESRNNAPNLDAHELEMKKQLIDMPYPSGPVIGGYDATTLLIAALVNLGYELVSRAVDNDRSKIQELLGDAKDTSIAAWKALGDQR